MRTGGSGASTAQSARFFYLTIKYGKPDDIRAMFDRLAHDVQDIVDGIIRLVYFMRGAVSYEEMMWRTPGERQRMDTFLSERLEAEKQKPPSQNY